MKTKKPPVKNGRRMHLHKRIALHASSIALVLSSAFLPMPFADLSLNVTARIPAPLPASPAVITAPIDGEHFTDPAIIVSGTCPTDSYVKVFRDGQLAGISNCTSNAFSVDVILAPDANLLTAKVYNITDDEGPSSPSITVFYDAPVVESPPPAAPTQSSPAAPPAASDSGPVLSTPYQFTIRKPHDEWQWDITAAGGRAPYAIVIDWGDGVVEHLTESASNTFAITNTYGHAAVFYPRITAADADGKVASLQLLAIVREPPTFAAQFLQDTLRGISPSFAGIVWSGLIVSVFVFWWYEAVTLHRHLFKKLRRKTVRRHA